jgi:hypothetical protein
MLFQFITLTLLVFIGAGCMGNKAARISKAMEKQIVVMPARSQPVAIVSHHPSSFIFGGMTGVWIEQASTSDRRKSLEERLNADAKTFTPEVLLAQECVKLLETSPRVRFKALVLRPDPVDVPGRSELIQDDPNAFKTSEKNIFSDIRTRYRWLRLYEVWVKTPPDLSSIDLSEHPESDLALQVTFAQLLLNHGNRMQADVAMRLLDRRTGRIIGKQYMTEFYKLAPVTTTSDLAAFQADFHKCVSDIAQKSLKKLKLL